MEGRSLGHQYVCAADLADSTLLLLLQVLSVFPGKLRGESDWTVCHGGGAGGGWGRVCLRGSDLLAFLHSRTLFSL